MCHYDNRGGGGEQTLNMSQHTKLTLEKEICRSCWDSNTQPYGHKSGAFPNKQPQYVSYHYMSVDPCCP